MPNKPGKLKTMNSGDIGIRSNSSNIAIPVHRFFGISEVFCELLRGRTIYRTYLNLWLRRFTSVGRTIDFGAKFANASYWEFLTREPGCEIMPTDLYSGEGVIAVDVQKALPFADASVDTIVALNLFEHVGDLTQAPAEFLRILRPGGRAIIATPFLVAFHGDPEDYWRFTDMGLARTFALPGMRIRCLASLGEGVLTLAGEATLQAVLPSRVAWIVFAVFYPLFSIGDRLLSYRPAVKGRRLGLRYPQGILLVIERN